MPVICKTCNLPALDKDRIQCVGCGQEGHLACMDGAGRGNMRCKSCPFGVSKMGDIGLSSTTKPLPSGNDQLLEENLRLKAMLVRLEMRLENLEKAAPPPPPESESSSTGEPEETVNRSQQLILESIRLEPLNSSELQCRKHVSALPKFSGNPSTWFRFISTYKDSTTRCGFSPVENLERINAALEDPARSSVIHLLERPQQGG